MIARLPILTTMRLALLNAARGSFAPDTAPPARGGAAFRPRRAARPAGHALESLRAALGRQYWDGAPSQASSARSRLEQASPSTLDALPTLFVSDVPPALVALIAFVFGAAWGSFFNVAIYRWPR